MQRGVDALLLAGAEWTAHSCAWAAPLAPVWHVRKHAVVWSCSGFSPRARPVCQTCMHDALLPIRCAHCTPLRTLQVEPVFQQLLQEVGAGGYLPVTSFPERCTAHPEPAASAA